MAMTKIEWLKAILFAAFFILVIWVAVDALKLFFGYPVSFEELMNQLPQ